MVDWFAEFLNWLVTSKNGQDEQKAKNNHGIWYDTQKLSFALFTGKNEIAMQTVEHLKNRIEVQMDDNGFFPAEMARTISLHYASFVIEPLFMASNMSQTLNVDLWNYTSVTGKSVRKGFEVMVPYLSMKKVWIGEQIKPFEFKKNAIPLLAQGYNKYHCDACLTALPEIDSDRFASNIIHLITLID
jgi:hypothetical protein